MKNTTEPDTIETTQGRNFLPKYVTINPKTTIKAATIHGFAYKYDIIGGREATEQPDLCSNWITGSQVLPFRIVKSDYVGLVVLLTLQKISKVIDATFPLSSHL